MKIPIVFHTPFVQKRTSKPAEVSATNYRADIDGLRAIAVTMVVIYHAFPTLLPGGFIGVDIFFVLSGFLISGVILSSLKAGTFSFTDFYVRRVRRIFPALIAVLLATYVLGWYSLPADQFKQLGAHVACGAGFCSNLLLNGEAGYFDVSAHLKPLLHLWSLGIEEQFYLAWPLVLVWVWRESQNKAFTIVTTTVVIACVSFVWGITLLTTGTASAAFFLPHARVWELLIGALVALIATLPINFRFPNMVMMAEVWLDERRVRVFNVNLIQSGISLLGLTLIAIALSLVTRNSFFPGWYALLPSLGCALVILAGPHNPVNRWLLSFKPLSALGMLSYSLYLWHWPLLSFVRMADTDDRIRYRLAAVAVSLLLAISTYKFVEKPLRYGRGPTFVAAALTVALAMVGFIGYQTHVRQGLPERQTVAAVQKATERLTSDYGMPAVHSECNKKSAYKPRFEDCRSMTNPQLRPTAALIGDSHARSVSPGLSEAFGRVGENLIIFSEGGCLPYFDVLSEAPNRSDVCFDLMRGALNFALESPHIKTIVLANYYSLYMSGHPLGDKTQQRSLKWASNNSDGASQATIYLQAMKNTLEKLTASRKKIVYILDNPEIGFNPRTCVELRPIYLTQNLKTPCGIAKSLHEERVAKMRVDVLAVLAHFPDVQIFDSSKYLCDVNTCWAKREGALLYRDADHLSYDGSVFIGKQFESEILKVGKKE